MVVKKESKHKIYLFRRVVYAKIYMDNHFNEQIDLSRIADEAFFSKFHFLRLFFAVYNKTPHKYLTHIRLEKAKQYLSTEMTIAEVCNAVGFESVSSFTGLFKRVAGQTPASYQLNQKNRLFEMQETPLKFIPNCFIEKNRLI